jgi:hypothetical protein
MSLLDPTAIAGNVDERRQLARDIAVELAPLLAELRSAPQRTDRLVDAATLAEMLGISRHAVYNHAQALGAVRIGDGPRGRLRFNPDTALEGWTHRSSRNESRPPENGTVAAQTRPGRRRPRGSETPLLPIHEPGWSRGEHD